MRQCPTAKEVLSRDGRSVGFSYRHTYKRDFIRSAGALPISDASRRWSNARDPTRVDVQPAPGPRSKTQMVRTNEERLNRLTIEECAALDRVVREL